MRKIDLFIRVQGPMAPGGSSRAEPSFNSWVLLLVVAACLLGPFDLLAQAAGPASPTSTSAGVATTASTATAPVSSQSTSTVSLLDPAALSLSVTSALKAAQSGASGGSHAGPPGELQFLSRIQRVGAPYPVKTDAGIERFLFPAILSASDEGGQDLVGGLIHVKPDTGKVLAWPSVDAQGEPLFLETESALRTRLTSQHASPAPPPESEPLYRPVPVTTAPATLPDVYLLRGWRRLPAKSQDPRLAWIDLVNRQGRYRTLLRYSPEEGLEPPRQSMSVAASLCADWWRARLGLPHRTYVNWLTGMRELGANPRELHVQYLFHGKPTIPMALLTDPVTGEGVPRVLAGFSQILTAPTTGLLPDPLEADSIADPMRFEIDASRYGMEGQFKPLELPPSGKKAAGKSPSPEEQALKQVRKALRDHGILLASVVSDDVEEAIALHGVAVIGVARVADVPSVLFPELRGDRGLDYPLQGMGRTRLMSVPISKLRDVHAFPHPLRLQMTRLAQGGRLLLSVSASSGRAIDLDALDVQLGGKQQDGVSLGGRTLSGLSASRVQRGRYLITVPDAAPADETARLTIAADAEYHRNPDGKPTVSSFLLSEIPDVP